MMWDVRPFANPNRLEKTFRGIKVILATWPVALVFLHVMLHIIHPSTCFYDVLAYVDPFGLAMHKRASWIRGTQLSASRAFSATLLCVGVWQDGTGRGCFRR